MTEHVVIGSIVHYVLADGQNAGQCRAALVVLTRSALVINDALVVNLAVFTDGQADGIARTAGEYVHVRGTAHSAQHIPRTYHFISECGGS